MTHTGPRPKAYGYVRVSVDDEAGNNASIASQKAAIEAHCEKEDIELIDIFEELGVSGRKLARKQFDRMMQEATRPERTVDQIIVYAMSRFARRLETQVVSQRRLTDAGVRLVSLTEHISDDDNGLMLTSFVAIMNEKYSRDAATFTRRDRRTNAKNGFYNGGKTPFGYEARTVAVDGRKERKQLFASPTEAPVIGLIYELADVGYGNGPMGARAIAEYLNLNGYSLRGGRFHNSSVSGILSRSHYQGYYLDRTKDDHGRPPAETDAIRIPCPALVDPEQAARIAASRSRRRPAVTAPRIVNGPTLLVGKTHCGCPTCGAGMTIRTGKGGRYSYYTCTRRANVGASQCSTRAIRRETLDQAVLDTLSERILRPDHLNSLLTRVLDLSEAADVRRRADLEQARAEQTRVRSAVGRLFELIETGLASPRDPLFAQRMKDNQSRLQALNARIGVLEGQMKRGEKQITPDAIDRFSQIMRDKLAGRDPLLCKAIVSLLIDRVSVRDDQIDIAGSTAALEYAVSKQDIRPNGTVPIFDREWCPEKDSNYLALGLELRLLIGNRDRAE